MRTAKAPKPNMEAIQDALFRIDDDLIADFTGTNGINIRTKSYCLTVDTILSINFRLYGVHNRLEVQTEDRYLLLHGATYRLLPEFLVEGEEVEFQIED